MSWKQWPAVITQSGEINAPEQALSYVPPVLLGIPVILSFTANGNCPGLAATPPANAYVGAAAIPPTRNSASTAAITRPTARMPEGYAVGDIALQVQLRRCQPFTSVHQMLHELPSGSAQLDQRFSVPMHLLHGSDHEEFQDREYMHPPARPAGQRPALCIRP